MPPYAVRVLQAMLRDRTALALAAAAAAIVAAVVLMAVAVGSRPPVAAPTSPLPTRAPVAIVTPSPTPAPTAPPTPAPTVAPTAPPPPPPPPADTPRPRPTTRTAGERMRPFYAEIRVLFPALPAGLVIDFDEPSGSDANAVFRGLTTAGLPIFSVREDFVLDRGTAAHEIGHAYQKIVEQTRGRPDEVLTEYWKFRGFSGTWQDAAAESAKQAHPSAAWIWSPIESWGEAFRAAVTLEVKEKTLDYGKTIDPQKARAFFLSLMDPPRR